MEAKISVIIPYYNDSLVFERTISSVINQTLKPFEIIVVDDCSDDSDNLKLLLDQIDYNIVLHRNSKNMNGSYSRNYGIRNAGGEIIAFLDGDDYWEPNHLQVGCEVLLREGVDFVYSNYIRVSKKVTKNHVTDVLSLKNKYDILFKNPPQTNSFIIRKNVFFEKKNYFDESLNRHQDWKFFIDAIQNNIKIKYIDEYTSYYCDSTRPLLSRVNYDSMLKFWCNNKKLFSIDKMEAFVINICVNCMLNKSRKEMYYIMGKYNFQYLINKNKIFFTLVSFSDNSYYVKFLYYAFFRKDIILFKLKKRIFN